MKEVREKQWRAEKLKCTLEGYERNSCENVDEVMYNKLHYLLNYVMCIEYMDMKGKSNYKYIMLKGKRLLK